LDLAEAKVVVLECALGLKSGPESVAAKGMASAPLLELASAEAKDKGSDPSWDLVWDEEKEKAKDSL
jgi:hypothetical protein